MDEVGLKKGGVRGEGALETDKTNVKVSGKENREVLDWESAHADYGVQKRFTEDLDRQEKQLNTWVIFTS